MYLKMSNLQIYPHLQIYPQGKYSTDFYIHCLDVIMSYFETCIPLSLESSQASWLRIV